MKAAEYIVELLATHGLTQMFGHIGGFNADILDAFCRRPGHRFTLTYHEQAGAFAANAYAAATGKTGVVTSSGAPGACNLMGGIANAYFDSHPVLFLTGSVHTKAVRTSPQLRQNTFEEADIVSLVQGITKYAVRVTQPNALRYELEKALYLAQVGRKGPVLLDIPYDVARAETDPAKQHAFRPPAPEPFEHIDTAALFVRLQQAKRPVILAGGGLQNETSRHLLPRLLEKWPVPVVATLAGLDVLPHEHPCFAGFIGHYGNRWANMALAHADFVLVLGARLEERQLGGYQSRLAPNAHVVRVDVDKAELYRRPSGATFIYSDTAAFLQQVSEHAAPLSFPRWQEVLAGWKKRFSLPPGFQAPFAVNYFFSRLSRWLPTKAILCCDVGQHQMSAAQSLVLTGTKRFLTSASYGSMGFALPAAVGASKAVPGTAVFACCGDGGLQMSGQELHTLVREQLPVYVIVFNNRCLGMIRRLQEQRFDGRTYASVRGYSTPDFGALAQAYGLPYLRVSAQTADETVPHFLQQQPRGLIEVEVPSFAVPFPEPGESLTRQRPLLSAEQIAQAARELVW